MYGFGLVSASGAPGLHAGSPAILGGGAAVAPTPALSSMAVTTDAPAPSQVVTTTPGASGGASCGAPVDVLFPGGCPSGFPLGVAIQISGDPNLGQPLLNTSGNGCEVYQCQNSAGQTPQQVYDAICSSTSNLSGDVPLFVMAGGAAGLLFLPGWSKLLGLVAIGAGFLQLVGSHQQAKVNADGSYTCVAEANSW